MSACRYLVPNGRLLSVMYNENPIISMHLPIVACLCVAQNKPIQITTIRYCSNDLVFLSTSLFCLLLWKWEDNEHWVARLSLPPHVYSKLSAHVGTHTGLSYTCTCSQGNISKIRVRGYADGAHYGLLPVNNTLHQLKESTKKKKK